MNTHANSGCACFPDIVLRNNANAALVFEFCYRVISICKSYFGKVDEESVKNNFVLIYELIDGAHLLLTLLHILQTDLSSIPLPVYLTICGTGYARYRNQRLWIPPE